MCVYNLTDIPDKIKLNDTELISAPEFIDNHKCHLLKRIFSKRYKNYYIVTTNSGIGVKLEIFCTRCKSRHDITDYKTW